MKNGIYIHRAEETDYMDRGATVTVSVTDTGKAICLKLIENTFRYLNGNLEMLLQPGKARINKERSPHAIHYGDDWFCIYPYRNGIPFMFDYIGNGKEQ